jgi:hypothetical protein
VGWQGWRGGGEAGLGGRGWKMILALITGAGLPYCMDVNRVAAWGSCGQDADLLSDRGAD